MSGRVVNGHAPGRLAETAVPDPLTIEYLYPADGVTVISLIGDCDLATVVRMKRALSYVVEDDPEVLVVDLSSTTFLDSTGLRAIYAANVKRRRKRRDGIVLVTNAMTRRVFEIAGMDPTMSLSPGLDAVLQRGGDGGADKDDADA
jgi:anti-sigma B factor antagonist